MTTTVAQRKAEQRFQKKAPCCVNCKFFNSQKKEEKTPYGVYIHETNLRCTYGEFKVGKSNWCQKYEPKQEE